MQVVGVVGAVKLKGLIEGENARAGAYYIPYAQEPSRGIGFAIRTAGDTSAALSSDQACPRHASIPSCSCSTSSRCPSAWTSR